MGNSDSMSPGGASSAIGPLLMRKTAPFRISIEDMLSSERNIFRDNMFGSVREQMENMGFTLDRTQISPTLNSRIQTVRESLGRAVAFKRTEVANISEED